MQKFIVLYSMPAEGLEAWAKVDESTRKTEEERMKAQWDAWEQEHKGSGVAETSAVGKTKRVTGEGVSDARNDIMLYTIVEADSHEAAAQIFIGHPHLQIPGAWIDISPINTLSEMENK